MTRSATVSVARAVAPALPVVLGGCVVATTSSGGNGGGIAALVFLLLPLVFFVLVARAVTGIGRSSRPRHRRVGSGPDVDGPGVNPSMVRAELSVLADDVLRLEPQVALHPEARDDYEAAVHRYRVAQAAMEQPPAEVDLVRVQRVVDEASWAMARVRAVLDGRPKPPPPAELQHPGRHGEPALRLEGERPVYVGTPATFRAGWFGGGLLGGMLLGPMIGGWMTSETFGPDGGGAAEGWADDGGW